MNEETKYRMLARAGLLVAIVALFIKTPFFTHMMIFGGAGLWGFGHAKALSD